MLTKFAKRIHEHTKNLNKEPENIKKNQSELKNTIKDEKCTGRNAQQTSMTGGGGKWKSPIRRAKRKQNFKNEDNLRDL